MEVKPGYKQTEVGVIPEDWEVDQLGTIAILERGKFTARPRNQPKFFGGDYPFIQTGDITNSNGNITTYTQTLNTEGLRVSKLFPRDTLFFTIAANIGDVGIAAFETAATDSVIAISPKPRIDKRWLYHSLKKRKKIFEGLATQNAQLNISLEKLRPYSIAVPPLPEQRAIAGALSDVDALLGALDQLIAKKRDLKQAAMQQLLTGQTRLPGFRGEWENACLGEKALKIGSGITPTGGEKIYRSEGRPFLRSQNVGWGILLLDDIAFIDDDTHATFPATEIEADDVFLNITGASIGRSAVSDSRVTGGNVNQHVCIIRPDLTKLFPRFLNYSLLSTAGQRQIDSFQAGGNRQGLNFSQIRSMSFRLPPLPEQTAIAEALMDLDAGLAALEQRRAKTRALKQGMMQELLTGRTRLV